MDHLDIIFGAFQDEMEKLALSPSAIQRALQSRARGIANRTSKKGLNETVAQMQRIHGLSQKLTSKANRKMLSAGAGKKGMTPEALQAVRRLRTEKAVEQGRRSAIKAQRGF
jgi:ParB-like chromosome segregation protein Spo0J